MNTHSLSTDLSTFIHRKIGAVEQGVLYKSRMEVSGWSIYYYLDKANITKG